MKVSINILILFIRFVDRDMVMRFMGGGIGHKATNAFTQAFAREARNLSMNDDPPDDENLGEDKDEEAGDSEVEDYGYVIESEAEQGHGDEEDAEDEDLGGEDGEEPWEMNDVQAEGFDEL
jgi:hypothetical protein